MNQQMKMKLHKLFGLILVFIITFSVYHNVNAANKSGKIDCKTQYSTSEKILKDFGVDMVRDGDTYTMSINPKSDRKGLNEKLKKVVFKIVKIEPAAGNESLIGNTIKVGSKLQVSITGEIPTIYGPGAKIYLEADLNANGANICNESKFIATITLQAARGDPNPIILAERIDLSKIHLQSTERGTPIDCSNYETRFSKDSFDYNFCLAKTKAQATTKFSSKDQDDRSGNTLVNFTNAFSLNDEVFKKYDDVVTKSGNLGVARQFKCNAKVNKTKEESLVSDEKYYEQNTHYMYGSGEKVYDYGYYKYHFKNEQATNGDLLRCKIVCEEAVTVKYGPPVAVKAGACFEYKIKVESRVSCYMSEPPKPPEIITEICIPYPLCAGRYFQGGPNESFDNCINSCDGGKYTDKCSDSCYKQVYGSSNNELPLTYNIKKTAMARADMTKEEWTSIAREANALAVSYESGVVPGRLELYGEVDGYYYIDPVRGVIWEPYDRKWSPPYPYPKLDFGIWYYYNPWGFGGYNYNTTENGIIRADNCGEYCTWINSNCGPRTYINHGIGGYDAEQNSAIYNDAVDKCKAKATCTTQTAEYTISADYEKKTGENTYVTTTVEFPRSGNKKADPDRLSTCKVTDKVNTFSNENTTLIDYAGCYSNSCDTENYYMTEWSFPDSWRSKKGDEVSFEKPTDTGTWRYKPKLFCLPNEVGNVNKKWSRWYYRNVEGVPEGYYCDSGSENKSEKELSSESMIDKWNIRGNTTHFGFFEWNIDIRCFYSVDKDAETESNNNGNNGSNNGKVCVEMDPEYRIRTVTNDELFPSPSGVSTTSGITSGREPGYNWTSDSALSDKVIIPEYVNDPVKVKEYIQEVGNKIYNGNDYIDYEFELKPEDLRAIKAYNKELDSFDIFCGRLEDRITTLGKKQETGITSYRSNLFRTTSIDGSTWSKCQTVKSNIINAKTMIDSGHLFCNNNNGTSSCRTIN